MNNNATEKKWVNLPEFRIPIRYDNAGDYLRALVQEKIDEMVKNGLAGVACRAQRLEEELDVLCQGFPENILIVKDFVDAARKAGHTVNANMDSACASQVLDILGDKSPYFGHVSERMALANKGNYREALNEYFRAGHQQGFQSLAEATDKLEEYIWNDYSRMNPALHVMVTHDINVGCFLAGRKVITQFDDSTWPHYLDSAVCFLDRYGRARYGFMRFHKNKYTFDC